MYLIISLVLFLSLGYDALAAPAAALHPQQRSKSFRVERVRRSDYIAHGPAALRKAYRKFGIVSTDFSDLDLDDFEPFDDLTRTSKSASYTDSSDGTDQTGSVSATSVQGDVEFVSPVQIGGQMIVMDFDTGSSDMWVLNSELPESMVSNRTVYNPSKSSTYKKVDGTFKISYGDSSNAQGGLAKDVVSIGGATVKNQVFGLPTSVSDSFISDENSNGLVGLGFTSINTFDPGPQKTFFDNIVPDLDEPVFTARLKSEGVGEYEFGKIDHDKYSGSLVNVTVDSSNGFWQFEAAQFAVGDGSLQQITDTPTAIADTGTSLMLVSPQVAKAYYAGWAQYSNSVSGYIFSCDADLPNLSVAIGNKFQATIPGSLINFAEIGTNKTTGGTVCYGGVQSNSGSSLQIFGDVFLKALFVVFDHRGPSLGFGSPK
ncbi:aspergillopepsin A-like aspartic endopeptidase [Penicillium waksmanii]|uniref:aspergillopepsin A-like aspartic endopeptidase n=1 Tax=Penicillium waksmanii TaxID=69791 RepID=UPI0025492EF6|nr:aspergillopepsin A-like aspartic endopeptidase [Penicillium waksmanii]KAJ5980753.1 aspergillopepsin A-like aspartic endopeptidase [Penicillium waksmanii]